MVNHFNCDATWLVTEIRIVGWLLSKSLTPDGNHQVGADGRTVLSRTVGRAKKLVKLLPVHRLFQ